MTVSSPKFRFKVKEDKEKDNLTFRSIQSILLDVLLYTLAELSQDPTQHHTCVHILQICHPKPCKKLCHAICLIKPLFLGYQANIPAVVNLYQPPTTKAHPPQSLHFWSPGFFPTFAPHLSLDVLLGSPLCSGAVAALEGALAVCLGCGSANRILGPR